MVFEGFFLLALVIVVVAVAFTKSRNDDINRAWGSVAQQLGMTLEPATLRNSPLLSGSMKGHDLTVDIHKRGGGQHKSVWTRFRLSMPPLGLGLKLKSEGFFDGLSKVFGTQDVEVGDLAFDDSVLVQGQSETALREFLTPERRRVIERFLSSFAGAVIADDGISLSSRGYVRRPEVVRGTIDAMLEVARSLTQADGDSDAMADEALAAEQPASGARLDPAPQPTQVEEPDAGAAAVDEPPGELQHIEVDATIESVAPTAPADSPTVEEFCDTVFAPGALSFVATQVFQKSFAGKRIVWSGMLESAKPYAFDFDFGARNGVKAVLCIRSDASGASAARDVKAVLSLPADFNGVENRIGQHLPFGGNLLKVDGLARRVFITDAELGGSAS